MIKSKKKNESVFGNLLDVVLIVAIIAILLCSYINVSKIRISAMMGDKTTAEITLTAMIPEIEDENSLHVGDKLYFESTKEYFGTVKSVNPIYKFNYKVNKKAGIAKRTFTDDVIGLSIKLDVSLMKNDNGLLFANNRIFIASGSRFTFYNQENSTFEADVYNVTYEKNK